MTVIPDTSAASGGSLSMRAAPTAPARTHKNTTDCSQAEKPNRVPIPLIFSGAYVTSVSGFLWRSLLSGDRSRAIFAAMVWLAFARPGDSENEVCERAGPVLGLSPRHVRRLLQKECSARVEHVLAVVMLIGFESAMKIIERGGR